MALAMGGYAMAQICQEPTRPAQTCALVYDFNLNLKTTVAKMGKVPKTPLCEDPLEAACYRTKTSRSLKGFIYSCDCWCVDIPASTVITSNFVDSVTDVGGVSVTNQVWDGTFTTNNIPAGFGVNENWTAALWDSKKNVYAFEEDFEWTAFWRIGKNRTDLEIEWLLAPGDALVWLQGQGFGSIDKSGRAKSMNGNVIGAFATPVLEIYNKDPDLCGDCEGMPWELCTNDPIPGVDTVAFGTWKMKYNNKASNTYKANGGLPYPKWFW